MKAQALADIVRETKKQIDRDLETHRAASPLLRPMDLDADRIRATSKEIEAGLKAVSGDKWITLAVKILLDRYVSGLYSQAWRVQKFDELDARLAELEAAQREFKYCGTYESGRTYRKGNFLTEGGSVWACLEDTADRPPSRSWQLAVKKGRDGAK